MYCYTWIIQSAIDILTCFYLKTGDKLWLIGKYQILEANTKIVRPVIFCNCSLQLLPLSDRRPNLVLWPIYWCYLDEDSPRILTERGFYLHDDRYVKIWVDQKLVSQELVSHQNVVWEGPAF